jgi:hypothetical protein
MSGRAEPKKGGGKAVLIKMVNGTIYIKQADEVQYAVIKSLPGFRWIKAAHLLQGPANLDTLDRLAKMVRLPEYIEAERQRLAGIRRAVDRERAKPNEEVRCLRKPPVKPQLFKHQQRAYNMSLLVFGIIAPEETS